MLFPSYCVCLLSVGPCMLMYLFYSVFKQHLFIYLFIFTLVLLSVGWFAGWSVSSITQKLLKRFKLGRGQIHWFFFSLSVTLWDIFVDFLGHNAWILIKKKKKKNLELWYLSEIKSNCWALVKFCALLGVSLVCNIWHVSLSSLFLSTGCSFWSAGAGCELQRLVGSGVSNGVHHSGRYLDTSIQSVGLVSDQTWPLIHVDWYPV